MTSQRSQQHLEDLVRELRTLSSETEWAEFKVSNAKPDEIGQYVSALANSAALHGRPNAYVVWGIDNTTHAVVGTTFSPAQVKIGNEELENWLLHLLSPQVSIRFSPLTLDGRPVVLLEIGATSRQPVAFRHEEYIRVGSYTKKLKEHPEKERELWRIFDATPFERMVAADHVTSEEVFRLLDYPAYFKLLGQPLPERPSAVLDALKADELVAPTDNGHWNITNLGAVLFARRLSSFRSLRRKAVRVVFYRDDNRIHTEREREGAKGYAVGFEGMMQFINDLLPQNEVIGEALRKKVPVYPELAVRELVANALIHQDFFVTGSGPMIEIFKSRMEITNPGTPLVETVRFLDSPPRSRNEMLASVMRRIGVCEERGSGVDKVVFQTEFYQLPAPMFETAGDSTRATLFAPRPMNKMDREDRVRACYLHACLKHVTQEDMTNTSLRARFRIEKHNSAIASKIIKETVAEGLIRPYDDTVGTRAMRYVPFWA